MGYALDLLNKRDEIPPSALNNAWNPVVLACAGFSMWCFSNWMSKRPLLSGIHRHGISALGGVALGIFVNKKRDGFYAERDAVLRHYVELHPEDFPDPVRMKYKDVLEKWSPIR